MYKYYNILFCYIKYIILLYLIYYFVIVSVSFIRGFAVYFAFNCSVNFLPITSKCSLYFFSIINVSYLRFVFLCISHYVTCIFQIIIRTCPRIALPVILRNSPFSKPERSSPRSPKHPPTEG